MINEKILEKLYNFVIEHDGITEEQLNTLGFNDREIQELVEQEVIQSTSLGCYKYMDFRRLCDYAKRLFKSDLQGARKYFERCLQSNADDLECNYHMFFYSIQDFDYAGSFLFLNKIYSSTNVDLIKNVKLYIYILSMIVTLPDEYRQVLDNLTEKELKLIYVEENAKFIKPYNQIIRLIWKKKFGDFFKVFQSIPENFQDIHLLIIKTLMLHANGYHVNMGQNIIYNIRQKNYEYVYETIFKRNSRTICTKLESYELVLVEKIMHLVNTGIIPKIKSTGSTTVFEAIENNDFDRAMEIEEEFAIINKKVKEASIFNYLLEELYNLISEIKKFQSDSFGTQERETISVEVANSNNVVPDILGQIQDKPDMDISAYVKEFLKSSRYQKYDFVVLNLIRHGNIYDYTKALLILTKMSKMQYEFELAHFIDGFYRYLKQGELEKAEVYFTIIKEAKKIGYNCVFTAQLEDLLQDAKAASIKDNNSSTKSELQENTDSEMGEHESDILMIDEYAELYDKVQSETMVFLKSLNQSDADKIIASMDAYADVEVFSVHDIYCDMLCIRKKPDNYRLLDSKKTFNDGKYLYRIGEYEQCIEYYKELIQANSVYAFIYALIGLCYEKLGKLDLALDFLIVARHTAKIENKECIYDTDIERIHHMLCQSSEKKISLTIKK